MTITNCAPPPCWRCWWARPIRAVGSGTRARRWHADEGSRYKKIVAKIGAMDRLLVDLFLEAHQEAPKQIWLDLDATDDPLHDNQEGRFFHGYYRHYCYLPLYIFCGEDLLCARLRESNMDGAAGSVEELERIVGWIRER